MIFKYGDMVKFVLEGGSCKSGEVVMVNEDEHNITVLYQSEDGKMRTTRVDAEDAVIDYGFAKKYIDGDEEAEAVEETKTFANELDYNSISFKDYPAGLETAEHDNINHPSHYCHKSDGIETIKIVDHMVLGHQPLAAVRMGNATKYMDRHLYKNGAEDLKKAIWYLQDYVDHYEEYNK